MLSGVARTVNAISVTESIFSQLFPAFSSRHSNDLDQLPLEKQRKIIEFRDLVMILIPEKPTSLRSIAEEAKRIKETQGGVVVAVAEGFMPPELKQEIIRLGQDDSLRQRWLRRDLPVESIPGLNPYRRKRKLNRRFKANPAGSGISRSIC